MYRKHSIFLIAVWCLALLFPVFAEGSTVFKYVKAEIPVTCLGSDSEEICAYQLECDLSDAMEVKQDLLYLKNGETGRFEVLLYDAGIYHCEICELDETGSGIDNQDAYCADIFVTEDETGEMYGETVIYKKGKSVKEEACIFRNEGKIKEPEISDVKNEETADSGKIRPDSGVRTGDMSKDIETMVLGMGMAGIICALAVRTKLRMKGGS